MRPATPHLPSAAPGNPPTQRKDHMTTTTLLDFQAEPRIETTDRSITYGWPVGWRRWTSPRDDDPRDVYQVWATLTIVHDANRRHYTVSLAYQQEQTTGTGRRVAYALTERIARSITLERVPCARYSVKTFDQLVETALAELRGCQDLDQIVEFRAAVTAACNTEAPTC